MMDMYFITYAWVESLKIIYVKCAEARLVKQTNFSFH